jgi:hypothetical protein
MMTFPAPEVLFAKPWDRIGQAQLHVIVIVPREVKQAKGDPQRIGSPF